MHISERKKAMVSKMQIKVLIAFYCMKSKVALAALTILFIVSNVVVSLSFNFPLKITMSDS